MKDGGHALIGAQYAKGEIGICVETMDSMCLSVYANNLTQVRVMSVPRCLAGE